MVVVVISGLFVLALLILFSLAFITSNLWVAVGIGLFGFYIYCGSFCRYLSRQRG